MMGKVDLGVDVNEDEEQAATTRTDAVDEDRPDAGKAADPDVVDEDAEPSDKLPPQAILNKDGSVTLPLKYPTDLIIKKDGRERAEPFKQLVFHRLTGADNRAIAAAKEADREVVAFARSTRLSFARMEKLYDKMDSYDLQAGGEVLIFFISNGRKTGQQR